jgi:hypothetical protein
MILYINEMRPFPFKKKGHKENDSKMSWMSWERMGLSKSVGGLGFRDLECFNMAMLAKQGWRLLHHQDSLAAQFLKEKYYPNNSFLSAHLGARPSFAWRSIFKSRDLLREGLVWRVGNGESIKIWEDKWLPSPVSYLVQSPIRLLPSDACVSSLIDPIRSGGIIP